MIMEGIIGGLPQTEEEVHPKLFKDYSNLNKM